MADVPTRIWMKNVLNKIVELCRYTALFTHEIHAVAFVEVRLCFKNIAK
jgi:hypothetical protein